MSLTNSYATLAEFLAQPEIKSDEPRDDEFVEDLLERASRASDAYCQTWFYADTQTRTYDMPKGRCLELDAPLLTVTTLTNGDGTIIAATEYNLWPYNGPNHSQIRIKQSSSTIWQPATAGDTEDVISVAGTWGYIDRKATDPESVAVILNTKEAVLTIALAAYKRRYGLGMEGVAQVTGAGVVITPRGIPVDAKRLLEPYRRLL